MKLIIIENNQRNELDFQLDNINDLKIEVKQQLNIDYQFEIKTTDNQNIEELQDNMEIVIKKTTQDKQQLKRLTTFFSEAGKLIRQKTLSRKTQFIEKTKANKNNNLQEIKDKIIEKQLFNDNQALTNQQIEEMNQKLDAISVIQRQDSANIQEERPSDRQILNEIKESKHFLKQNISQEQKKRPKLASIQQQSQTQKEKAFAFAEEIINIPKQNKRQQILQRMEEDKAEKEKLAKQQQQANRKIRQIQEKIKMKEEIIKQKDDALIITELERRKAVLAQKRELSQPIRLNELSEHQKKYEEEKKIKEYEREHQKQENEIEAKQKALKFPKSHAQLRVEEEERFQKEKRQQEMEQKKLARIKQLKYADVVQEIYFKEHPIKPKQQSPQKDEQSLRQIRDIQITDKNIKQIKKFIIPQRHLSHDSKDSLNDHSNHQENRPPRPIIKKLQKVVEKQVELPPKPKQIDYLQQMRQSKKNQVPVEEQWEKIIDNKQIQNEQKYLSVLNNVQKLEQKAKEREQLALCNRDVDAEEEANNLYIASIKAKIAILQQN